MAKPKIDVTSNVAVAKVTLRGVPDEVGAAGEVFGSLGEAGHNVELVVSSGTGGGRADISFAVREEEIEEVLEFLRKVRRKVGARDVAHNREVAMVTVAGPALAETPGVAGRMFRSLSEVGINIDLISTSITSVTCVIARQWADKAVSTLEREFGLDPSDE